MQRQKASPEAQKMEYKSSWQEEYYEWICGYANAKGGILYIGVNDDGYVVGTSDIHYLLDILPNNVVNTMGIVIEVDYYSAIESEENLKYEIVPDDIAMRPVNLYVRGLLTLSVLEEIDVEPERIKNVSNDVRRLFDAAPGFVKQLRQRKEYREKVRNDILAWEKERLLRKVTGGKREYISISVSAYPNAIEYHGHYYIRSGGTTRELKGVALSTFLMERNGKHWDGIAVPGLAVSDLDTKAIDSYRKKAVEKGRHSNTDVNVPDEQIISDLKLFDSGYGGDGGLTRAAVMLFHSDPEKYVTGSSVKIAYFAPEGAYGENKADDIIYHDEIHGSIIDQADRVVDLVYTKYLKALVSYDGLQRIETFMAPKEAFREVILNAINHKVYESGNPIQISVYEDKMIVFNQGYWPEDIALKDLYVKKHSSYPHNPNMSRVLYQAGEIEAYGSGFNKIKIECDKANAPYPNIEITPNGVTVEIKACDLYMKLLKHGRYWKTYPDYKVMTESILEDGNGSVITDNNGSALVVYEKKDLDRQTIVSIDRMMEILARELSNEEKDIFLPIAEYLKTHDVIKNADVMRLTGKGASSTNRYLNRLVNLKVLDPEGEKKGRIYRRREG